MATGKRGWSQRLRRHRAKAGRQASSSPFLKWRAQRLELLEPRLPIGSVLPVGAWSLPGLCEGIGKPDDWGLAGSPSAHREAPDRFESPDLSILRSPEAVQSPSDAPAGGSGGSSAPTVDARGETDSPIQTLEDAFPSTMEDQDADSSLQNSLAVSAAGFLATSGGDFSFSIASSAAPQSAAGGSDVASGGSPSSLDGRDPSPSGNPSSSPRRRSPPAD